MFKPLQMGTNHMLGVDSWVPLTTNNFEIRIYNMDGSTPVGYADMLTLTTNSIGEIQESQEAITVHYANGVIKFPAKTTFNDVTWTLNCFCEPPVLEFLRQWRKEVYDPETEIMGLPSEYMKQVYFIRYDGQGNARDIIRCPGAWISALNNGGGDQAGGSVVQVSVTLVISKAIYLKPEDFR